MKLQNTNKPVRLVLVSVFALIFVLSACSTGTTTAETPAADQFSTADVSGSGSGNTTNTQATAPAEDSGNPADNQDQSSAVTATVSFATDVLPIFESRCIQCHGGDKTEGDLVLLTYAQMMEGGEDGQVVIPGDADNSLLAQLIIDQKMPKRGPKLTPAQTQIIVDWINEGALDN
ncbi:hypothetical protein KQH61_04155 [bacterium]|nr:hypothetical protein [bacterium]MCB2179096.1 hypothetical protein [bacterium]